MSHIHEIFRSVVVTVVVGLYDPGNVGSFGQGLEVCPTDT